MLRRRPLQHRRRGDPVRRTNQEGEAPGVLDRRGGRSQQRERMDEE